MAHLALSMMTRWGTPVNRSKARRWQPSEVATVWSQTNSTYWWRLLASVITNAQVRRGLPSGGMRVGPAAGGVGRQLAANVGHQAAHGLVAARPAVLPTQGRVDRGA